MTLYRQHKSFVIPRCKAVPTPTVHDMVRHPPPNEFRLSALKPDRALASNFGYVWPRECEPAPPYRELSRIMQGGRLVAYRDGLLFLPNTNLARLADVGKELKDAAGTYAGFLGAEFDLKAHFLSGADKDIAEAIGEAAEYIEDLLTHGGAASAAREQSEMPASVRSSLTKKDAVVLPYAQMVEVMIMATEPESWWERAMTVRRDIVCLVREDNAGKRSAYSFNLGPDENKNLPFGYAESPDRHEAIATALVGARAESDIGALWRDAERERFGEGFLGSMREQAAKSGDPKTKSLQIAGDFAAERKRAGTTDATIARIVLDRLGGAADTFARALYAAHKIRDPIAKLRATAAGKHAS